MIVSVVLCHDCQTRYEAGQPADGSDAMFHVGAPFDPHVEVRCPRCRSTRVSLSLKPDPVDELKRDA